MRVQFSSFHSEGVRQVRERFAAQPSWVVRAALIAFVVVVIIPIALLLGIAFLVAMLVFTVLGLISRLGSLLPGRGGSLWRGRDGAGRRNVKVLPREG